MLSIVDSKKILVRYKVQNLKTETNPDVLVYSFEFKNKFYELRLNARHDLCGLISYQLVNEVGKKAKKYDWDSRVILNSLSDLESFFMKAVFE